MSAPREIRTLRRAELRDDILTVDQPVLITDGIVDWPAVKRWSPEVLAGLAPRGMVTMSVSFKGSFRFKPDGSLYDSANQLVVPQIPFSKAAETIIDNQGSGAKYYINQQDVLKKLPELLSDLNCWWPTEAVKTNLWFGSAGVISPLHYDPSSNLFGQIHGSKRFSIFAPDEADHLYPYPPDCAMSHLSNVDVEKPDLHKYPKFALAQKYVVEVSPGQMLFLPPFWWHHVESLSISISVNQWSVPLPAQCGGRRGLGFLCMHYVNDRWKGYRKAAKLTGNDLLACCNRFLYSNPGAALLAASIALDDTDIVGRTGVAPSSLENARVTLNSLIVEMLKNGAEHDLPDGVRSAVASVLTMLSPNQQLES